MTVLQLIGVRSGHRNVVIWNPVRITIARIKEIFVHFLTSVQKEKRLLRNSYASGQEMLLIHLLLFRMA